MNEKAQKIIQRSIDHCLSVDWDFIEANYNGWDEYLGETLGCTEQDINDLGVKLPEELFKKGEQA